MKYVAVVVIAAIFGVAGSIPSYAAAVPQAAVEPSQPNVPPPNVGEVYVKDKDRPVATSTQSAGELSGTNTSTNVPASAIGQATPNLVQLAPNTPNPVQPVPKKNGHYKAIAVVGLSIFVVGIIIAVFF